MCRRSSNEHLQAAARDFQIVCLVFTIGILLTGPWWVGHYEWRYLQKVTSMPMVQKKLHALCHQLPRCVIPNLQGA
ncbi:hypothetical protein LUCX_199 [Xanthomonas phage vB_XciM_LucasX]|nr:hypothetical protein LUCX_199 [Xanthomonas phage vB_XciM_LucasX]